MILTCVRIVIGKSKKELFVLVAERGNSGSGNISKVKEKFAAAILDIDIYSERE